MIGLLLFFTLVTKAASSEPPFPEYECLKSNVDFWVQIYTRYPSTTGVIHDRDDLSLIYGSIDLLPEDAPRAIKINRRRSEKAIAKYAALLRKLATGASPQSTNEKRILTLFGEKPSAKLLREASKNIRIQRGQKDHFAKGLVRSGRYLEKIKQIFMDYGLPSDLAYLPHVESSFNYEAYSKFGAAGIWQFTRSTGKRYLTIDYTVDERRDPIRSTQAAAQYLKENFDLLGNWPLAITAYNHGEAGMMRAIAEKGTYVRIFEEYEKGYFKFASRNFYSEFLAARKVAINYQQYFGALPIEKPQQETTITLKGFLPVSEALSLFKVDETTLRRFNPALRTPIFVGQKYIPEGYNLRLPGSLNGGTVIAKIPASAYLNAQKRSLFYAVARGDTAGSIAARQRVKLRDLILANNLDNRATIYIGQHLRIPTASASRQEVAKNKSAPQAEPQPVVLTASDSKRKGTTNIAATDANKSGQDVTTESNAKAKSGSPTGQPPLILTADERKTKGTDTNIAAIDANESGQEMASENNPKAKSGSSSVSSTMSLAVATRGTDHLAIIRTFDKKGVQYGVIRVAPEETIGHYAEWLNIPAAQIRAANRKRKRKPIRTDQELVIPLTQVSKTEFEEKRIEFHKEIEEDFFAAYHISDVTEYRIQKGDTIWELCYEKLDLPIWLLKKYNASVDFNSLRPNQKLQVPQLASDQS